VWFANGDSAMEIGYLGAFKAMVGVASWRETSDKN